MASGTVTLLTGIAMYVGVVVSLAGVVTALARFFFKRLDQRLDRIDIRNTQAEERYGARLVRAEERYEARLIRAEERYEARLAEFRLSIAERDKRYDAKFTAMISENNRQAEEGRRRMAELCELLAGNGERLSHVEGYLRIGTRSQAEHKPNPATSETLTPEEPQFADR
ncbi:MAG: hypothetical protein OXI96_03905 [Acidimicrobiaceae bacterium]|nr:hypothetical protein [Acidimicrobiaceae bacterium]